MQTRRALVTLDCLRGWSVAALALLSVPVSVRAAHASPQARLVYGRGGGASDVCPDEAALRRAVATRIGYDPFFPSAPRTVVVTITPKGARLLARVQLVDDTGHAQGARELDSAEPDCASLFDTVALTISIAIDPQALARSGPPPAVSEPPHAPSPVPSPPPVAPVSPLTTTEDDAPIASDHTAERVPAPAKLRIGAALRGSLGLSPGLAAGASAYVGAAWDRFSFGLEVQGDFPASASVGTGSTVTAWLLSGALVPCFRLAPIEACALVVVGRFDATATGVTSPQERAAPYVGLGGRFGLEIPVSSRFSLLAHADVLANTYEASLLVAGAGEVWTAPAVGGVLGLGALASF